MNTLAKTYVPFLDRFPSGYHWSLMQVEYSWDIVWRKAENLAPDYSEISRQAILTVKAAVVAKFLGKRLSAEAEVTSDFGTRIEGTRIKHKLGLASVKMYDKRERVLRILLPAVLLRRNPRSYSDNAGGTDADGILHPNTFARSQKVGLERGWWPKWYWHVVGANTLFADGHIRFQKGIEGLLVARKRYGAAGTMITSRIPKRGSSEVKRENLEGCGRSCKYAIEQVSVLNGIKIRHPFFQAAFCDNDCGEGFLGIHGEVWSAMEMALACV